MLGLKLTRLLKGATALQQVKGFHPNWTLRDPSRNDKRYNHRLLCYNGNISIRMWSTFAVHIDSQELFHVCIYRLAYHRRLFNFLHKLLQWRQNEIDCISNHQRLDCLLNRFSRHRSNKTSKLRVSGLFDRNPPLTGGFPTQKTSNAKNVSIWWRHHAMEPSGSRILDIEILCISLSVKEHHR